MTFTRIDRRQKIGEPIVITITIDQLQADGTYDQVPDITSWTLTAKARSGDASGAELGDFTFVTLSAEAAQLTLSTVGFTPGVVAVDVRAASSPTLFFSQTLNFQLELAVTR